MLYDYECEHCNHSIEDVHQSIKDKPLIKCPKCKKHKLQRVITGGAYAFVAGCNTIGGLADKNTKLNQSKIQEEQHRRSESCQQSEKPSYHGSATNKEIKAMTPQQQQKYIMEGKK
ncbi:MAG TPA: zinc ribbon domain-containing protein [Flavobacteriales bacterium]|nr:zinc ribbon domain-containing protein [Flavobacteriales bacterium]